MLKFKPMKRLALFILISSSLIFGIYYGMNHRIFSKLTSWKDKTNMYTENLLVPQPELSKKSEKKYVTSIDIDYLRSLNIDSKAPKIEQTLSPGSNYQRYIASYNSEGNKIYGLLTVPNEDPPKGGFPAIVFNHGYIPPKQYVTTQRYIAYVDGLARNGFVVFKIDLRGNGDSEGTANGSYFSNGYTVDAIHALKSLQKLDYVNGSRIGMWGHSMAGNLVLRAMEVSDEIKAGVIWSGAVYSYQDFAKYGLRDSSYVRREPTEEERQNRYENQEVADEIQKLRDSPDEIDFNSRFWKNISLTANIKYLNSPLELHQAINDPVVNIGYTRDLVEVLEANNKQYEEYEYAGGGHNIESPYFETAMQRTVDFFKKNL